MNAVFAKLCPKCRNMKTADQFSKNRAKKDGLQSLCKSCKNDLSKLHYVDNKDQYLARNVRNFNAKLAWYIELKSFPCTDCNQMFHHSAMEWDHLPEYDKTNDISHLLKVGSRQAILDEIAKCELVCANCHRIRTYNRNHCPVV